VCENFQSNIEVHFPVDIFGSKEIACVVKIQSRSYDSFQSIPSVSLRSTSLSYEKIIFFSSCLSFTRSLDISWENGRSASFACVPLIVSVRKCFTADIGASVREEEIQMYYVWSCLYVFERKILLSFSRKRRKKSSQKRPKIKNLYAERNERRHLDGFCVLYLWCFVIKHWFQRIFLSHTLCVVLSAFFFSLNLHDH
jgi:hypothetical protein